MGKIIVAGDIHGDWGGINSLINKHNPDYILQCGDFGWWPGMESNKWKLKGIKSPNTKILWCDGNHEDHWDLKRGNGSYDNVIYMSRGSIYTLPDGRNILFIGGADSIDKNVRTLGIDWFPEELITYADLEKCLSHKIKIDIVISHTCPEEFELKLGETYTIDKYKDPSRQALSVILNHYKPDLWYFGHWHMSQKGKYNNTYWQCLDMPNNSSKWWDYLK